MHRFDVKTIKMLSYVPNHSKHSKTTKVIKLRWIASIWCQKHQTTQNYKSDQFTTKCMDLTSKRTKMFCYVGNHSKQRKTTKVIKLRWIASIWRQNDQKCLVTSQTIQNNSNLQKYSNCNELHRFDVKNIKQRKTTKVIKLRRSAWIWRQSEQKCFVTSETIENNATKIYKMLYVANHQNNANLKKWMCMDLTSKRTKMLSYVANHSKQRKSKKVIKIQWIASIWCQNDKNVELRPKPF